MMELRRYEGETKKHFYRRVAEIKKQQWIRAYQQQES